MKGRPAGAGFSFFRNMQKLSESLLTNDTMCGIVLYKEHHDKSPITKCYKLGFVGQGLCPCTPLKELLKKFLKNPQNFKKGLFISAF